MKPGQIVQVRVLQVDVERNRVNLSMKAEGASSNSKAVRTNQEHRGEQKRSPRNDRPEQKARPQNKQAKPQNKPQGPKIGGLGELLLQAGVKKSK